ncbi:MAG: hypothetical protein PHS93_03825 [Candidatus Omnitrophica bacterium]|nr:hypothetical protein [Candidatus Omnitrophota bacterium]MDD5352281.1 hypothetical protein [Candidatus Omnitrophota bacterium]MDD5549879.1 hypothetical protein [Candidatus Omnitrophota bacterium]
MAQESSKKVNCVACNKALKIVKRYYRDGKYFCNKNCYKAFLKKQTEEKQEKEKQEKEKQEKK